MAKVRARKKLKTGEGVELEDSKLNDEQKSEESNEINEKERDESLKTSEIDEKTDEESTVKTSGTTTIPEWARHKISKFFLKKTPLLFSDYTCSLQCCILLSRATKYCEILCKPTQG